MNATGYVHSTTAQLTSILTTQYNTSMHLTTTIKLYKGGTNLPPLVEHIPTRPAGVNCMQYTHLDSYMMAMAIVCSYCKMRRAKYQVGVCLTLCMLHRSLSALLYPISMLVVVLAHFGCLTLRAIAGFIFSAYMVWSLFALYIFQVYPAPQICIYA